MRNGLCKAFIQCQESHHRSKRDGELSMECGALTNGQGGTYNGNEHIAEVGKVTIHRHNDIGDFVGTACRRPELLVDAFEFLSHLLLMAEYLNDLLPRHHLFNESIDTGQALLLSTEIGSAALAQLRSNHHHHHRHQYRYQCQWHTHHHHRGKRHGNGDDRVEHLGYGGTDHLTQRVHVIGIDRHHLAMRVLVEITDGQTLHPFEDSLAQTQHRSLRDIDHQAVVEIRACNANQQHESQFEQSLRKRIVFRTGHFGQRNNVVVDQRTGEQRRSQCGDRRDGDADQDGEDGELIVLKHIFGQSPDNSPFLTVYFLDTTLVLNMRASWASSEIRLSHASPPFLSKSPRSEVCIS